VFAPRFFAPRYFAPRYWAPGGGVELTGRRPRQIRWPFTAEEYLEQYRAARAAQENLDALLDKARWLKKDYDKLEKSLDILRPIAEAQAKAVRETIERKRKKALVKREIRALKKQTSEWLTDWRAARDRADEEALVVILEAL